MIFDFDGTLADTFPAFQNAFQQAILHFGLRPVDAGELHVLRGKSARELIAHLGIPVWKVPCVGNFVRGLMTAHPVRLFAGMDEVLHRLARTGVTLAVVSSNSEANVRAGLGPELAVLFAAFECGAGLFGKAARFRKVVKRTGCARHEVLAVGDELRDAEAAHATGLAFGAVGWGYTELEALQRTAPAAVFRKPEDLLRL